MKHIWEKWKSIAAKIGDFQFRAIFSIFYFILIAPFGVGTWTKDFLKTRKFPQWLEMEKNASTLKNLRKQ